MLKIAIAAVALAVTASTAVAQSGARPYSPRMSCASAAGLIEAHGAVVMSTSPTTYDRFVRGRAFCTPSETLRPYFAPTADNPHCFVGYTCEDVRERDRPF